MPDLYRPSQEPEPSDAEFDASRYPERISGKAMPQFSAESVEVEVYDSLGNKELVQVPPSAVTRLNMPKLHSSIPDEVKAPFEEGIGLAMIACRVEELQEDLARISLPVIGGDQTLLIKQGHLVKHALTGQIP